MEDIIEVFEGHQIARNGANLVANHVAQAIGLRGHYMAVVKTLPKEEKRAIVIGNRTQVGIGKAGVNMLLGMAEPEVADRFLAWYENLMYKKEIRSELSWLDAEKPAALRRQALCPSVRW